MTSPEVEAGRAFIQLAVVPFIGCVLAVIAAVVTPGKDNKLILGVSAALLAITAALLIGRGLDLIESAAKSAPKFPLPVFPRRGDQV